MASVTKGKDPETMKPEQNAKITLYWLEKSRSQRILFLLEHLHLTYSLKTYPREKMLAPPSLKSVHPLGKIPILTIENTNTTKNPEEEEEEEGSTSSKKPLVLAESGFIVEYLIEHFGPWMVPERYEKGHGEGEVGRETESWIRYRYYMHYAEGSLMPYLVIGLILTAIKSSTPFFLRPLALLITSSVESNYLSPNLKTQFDFLESQLATAPQNGEFLCGAEMTGADVMMITPLGASKKRSFFTPATHPRLCAYVDRLEAMEGYKRAVQKIVDVDGKCEDL